MDRMCVTRALEKVDEPGLGSFYDSRTVNISNTGFADLIRNQRVFLRVNDGAQRAPKDNEVGFFEIAFEDAFLNSHTVVLAGSGYEAQAFWGRDVVGDESDHMARLLFFWNIPGCRLADAVGREVASGLANFMSE